MSGVQLTQLERSAKHGRVSCDDMGLHYAMSADGKNENNPCTPSPAFDSTNCGIQCHPTASRDSVVSRSGLGPSRDDSSTPIVSFVSPSPLLVQLVSLPTSLPASPVSSLTELCSVTPAGTSRRCMPEPHTAGLCRCVADTTGIFPSVSRLLAGQHHYMSLHPSSCTHQSCHAPNRTLCRYRSAHQAIMSTREDIRSTAASYRTYHMESCGACSMTTRTPPPPPSRAVGTRTHLHHDAVQRVATQVRDHRNGDDPAPHPGMQERACCHRGRFQ